MNTNTVSFPSARAGASQSLVLDPSTSNLSYPHNSALEICDLIYGSSTPSWQAIERFYDPSATYENPFITATSREAIADIHILSASLANVDFPRPAALLYRLLGISTERWSSPTLFQAMSTWHEITDISESETFESHRKTIVEHTLHIVILPGFHGLSRHDSQAMGILPRTVSSSRFSFASFARPTRVSILSSSSMPDLNTALAHSPLHLRFPMITRLSFNDAGSITNHRDFWDVKDLLGLVPGMTLAQWICTRMVAQSIRAAVSAGRFLLRHTAPSTASYHLPDIVPPPSEDEANLSPASAYKNAIKTKLMRGDSGGDTMSDGGNTDS